MRLGNVIASIGIVIGVVGFICLPLWNLHELPYLADTSYPKGSGWILLIQTGIFVRPGIYLIVLGIILYVIAKLLPKKYWYTKKDLYKDEIRKEYEYRKNRKKNK